MSKYNNVKVGALFWLLKRVWDVGIHNGAFHK